MSDFGELRPKWDVFSKPLPWKLRDLCGKWGRKILTARDGQGLQENSDVHTQQGEYESCMNNIKRKSFDVQHAQDQHRFKPDKVFTQTLLTQSPTPNQKATCNW